MRGEGSVESGGSGELRREDEHPESRRMVGFREETRRGEYGAEGGENRGEGHLGGNLVECVDEDVFIRRDRLDSRTPESWERERPGTAENRKGPAQWRVYGRARLAAKAPWSAGSAGAGGDLPRMGERRKDTTDVPNNETRPPREGRKRQGERRVQQQGQGGLNVTIPNGPAGDGGRPAVMPAQFDGTTDLDEFMAHFRLCVRANKWDERTAGMYLGISLRGNARRLLSQVALGEELSYYELVQALEQRFQPRNQAESHKALFRSRDRRPDEDLYSYSESLERLARLGYPDADAETICSLAKDRFLDGLKDSQLRYFILYSQPRSLEDAVTVGVRAEAHLNKDRQAARKSDRVFATDATMVEELESLRREFSRELRPLRADFMRELANLRKDLVGQGPSTTGTRPTQKGCFRCGKEGHFRRECPEKGQAEVRTAPPGAAGAGEKEVPASGNGGGPQE